MVMLAALAARGCARSLPEVGIASPLAPLRGRGRGGRPLPPRPRPLRSRAEAARMQDVRGVMTPRSCPSDFRAASATWLPRGGGAPEGGRRPLRGR